MAKSQRAIVAQREIFLVTLERCGNVVESCEAAKVPRRTIYQWKKSDPAFAEAWELALESGVDALEAEAIRRAHDGVEKPIVQGGVIVTKVREYSDQLLMFLLRAGRPEKYRERSTLDLNVVSGLASRLDAAQRRVEDKKS